MFDDYNHQYFPPIPQSSNAVFIVNLDTLHTLNNNDDNIIFPFQAHLNDIYKMELDDDADSCSATELSTASANLFFANTLDLPSVPRNQILN